jgi:hypothetical protein
MEADVELWQRAGAAYGVGGGGTGYHQAGGVQGAGTVRALDGLVD